MKTACREWNKKPWPHSLFLKIKDKKKEILKALVLTIIVQEKTKAEKKQNKKKQNKTKPLTITFLFLRQRANPFISQLCYAWLKQQ